MGVYGRVSRSPGQVLTVAIWDMLTGLWVAEALGETKVNNIYVVLLFANSDQEIVWFDISVQEMA